MTQMPKTAPETLLLDRSLSLPDAAAVAGGRLKIGLTAAATQRCEAAHDRLAQVIAEDRHVYGITTGFGPLANRLIDTASGTILQQNLVHHLATGLGPRFGWVEARAIVLARLMSVVQGVSGASPQAIAALLRLLNSDLAPTIPSRGTVGASGDLTPLAHMVLCLQGRGEFFAADGAVVPGPVALARLDLAPLDLAHRDGLALVNGTSAMTGVATLNAVAMERALQWSVALTAVLAETQNGRVEAWHAAFGQVRPHPGQIRAATGLRAAVLGSDRVIRTHLAARRLSGVGAVTEDSAGQDAYTLRCAPQVIGAVWETALWHGDVVATELQSATDNPIFPPDDTALHGGNFMGQHVALASDALANAVVVLAGLAERQIARVTDERLNRGLPAFLHRGPAGLNSGLMGAQVTATALLAEMRSTGAASIHSISTNGANQDVVSMGTIAARLVADKVAMLQQIHGILALCLAQAVDILSLAPGGPAFSPAAIAMRALVRSVSPEILQDRPLSGEIEAVARLLADSPPAVQV